MVPDLFLFSLNSRSLSLCLGVLLLFDSANKKDKYHPIAKTHCRMTTWPLFHSLSLSLAAHERGWNSVDQPFVSKLSPATSIEPNTNDVPFFPSKGVKYYIWGVNVRQSRRVTTYCRSDAEPRRFVPHAPTSIIISKKSCAPTPYQTRHVQYRQFHDGRAYCSTVGMIVVVVILLNQRINSTLY